MSSCSKIILLGEHSVVYGTKAIVVAMKNICLNVVLQDEYIEEEEHTKYIKNLIENKYTVPKKYIKVISNIPRSSGLGSSAALGLEISKKYKEHNDKIDIVNIATLAEKKVHLNPSGVDLEVILNEKALIFQKNKKSINIDKLGAYLAVMYSNETSDTKKAIEHVQNINRMDLIENLGNITEEGISAYISKDIRKFGKCLNKAQKNLKKLGLSTKKIDEILKVSKYFSLGQKLTGAGLGGTVIALCDTRKKANKLLKRVEKLGVKQKWIVEV